MNQSVAWNSPDPNIRRTDRPDGTPPPVYSSKRNRRGKHNRKKQKTANHQTQNLGLQNQAFYSSSRTLPQSDFGPPQQSQWI